MTEGHAREEAPANPEDAIRGWIELALEDGGPIPEVVDRTSLGF